MKNISLKIIVAFLIILTFLTGLIFILKSVKQSNISEPKKIKVVTTLFPLYDIAKSIGGNEADVLLLLPPGVEPHSFEPKPSDIIRINEADIFIYTGKFMEPWAEDIINSVTNKNIIIVNASSGVTLIPAVSHDADEPRGAPDPHIWLDFDNLKIIAQNIGSAFLTKDSGNYDVYNNKLNVYLEKINELDSRYQEGLLNCETKKIIYGGHYAFGYLARRYGLKYLAAQGISPDAEPTAKDLINLINQIKDDRINYVFYEELTSTKIAETIASETNAKMLLLNAGHNLSKSQIERGVILFDILGEDLENLRTGLNCR